ncbi:MAG: hypothetical protein J1F35_04260 [Erysipelotrichales bacterium]|nr:hypothetical protein [Erysipelotrichales bacterium]
MNNFDFISYHGTITSIRDNVDDKYIWFDIVKYEIYTDKDGTVKTNPSFFSARIYKHTKYKLKVNNEVYVKGIPKGYIDKKGYRQNYIHVNKIDGIMINEDNFEKIISYDTDGVQLWHGKRCEDFDLPQNEYDELKNMLDKITGDKK